MVAGHGSGFAALERPHGHACGTLLRHADESVGEVGNTVGLDERVRGMRGTKGIPEREGSVVMLACGELMDLVVHAAVLAIRIVKELRAKRHVIKRCIEDFLLRGRGKIRLNA